MNYAKQIQTEAKRSFKEALWRPERVEVVVATRYPGETLDVLRKTLAQAIFFPTAPPVELSGMEGKQASSAQPTREAKWSRKAGSTTKPKARYPGMHCDRATWQRDIQTGGRISAGSKVDVYATRSRRPPV